MGLPPSMGGQPSCPKVHPLSWTDRSRRAGPHPAQRGVPSGNEDRRQPDPSPESSRRILAGNSDSAPHGAWAVPSRGIARRFLDSRMILQKARANDPTLARMRSQSGKTGSEPSTRCSLQTPLARTRNADTSPERPSTVLRASTQSSIGSSLRFFSTLLVYQSPAMAIRPIASETIRILLSCRVTRSTAN